MTKKELGILIILATLNFTHILDFMIIMPLNAVFADVIGIGPTEFSLLVSSYSIAGAVVGLISAFFIDKLDRKKALLVVYFGFIVGTLFCALSVDYHEFLLARMFTGVFAGVLGALVYALVGDLFPIEKRGRAVGYLSLGFTASSLVGVPLGLYLGINYGWNMPFYLIVGLALIVWVVAWRLIPTPKKEPEKSSHGGLKFVRDTLGPNQRLSLLFFMVLIVSQFAVIPFISDYMERNVGFSEEQLPLIYIVGGVLTIFSSPLIGRLADKYGKKRMLYIMLPLSLIPLLWITHLGPSSLFIGLAANAAFFVIVGSRMIPATAIVISSVDLEHRGSFLSLRSSVQYLATGLAATIAGLIVYQDEAGIYHNYEYVGYLGVLLTGVAALLLKPIKLIS